MFRMHINGMAGTVGSAGGECITDERRRHQGLLWLGHGPPSGPAAGGAAEWAQGKEGVVCFVSSVECKVGLCGQA